jgi:hypothetical protein
LRVWIPTPCRLLTRNPLAVADESLLFVEGYFSLRGHLRCVHNLHDLNDRHWLLAAIARYAIVAYVPVGWRGNWSWYHEHHGLDLAH